MNKTRPNPPQKEAGGGRRPGRPPLALRILATVFVLWHFAGVFLAALSVPASSPLVYRIAQEPPMQWYLDALYLNQGHSFFAPEVGPGHAIYYEVFDESGRVIREGALPRTDYWPRLRYHRHFMLADQAILPSPNEQYSNYWQRMYLESYARHLLRVTEEAESVRVRRYAHWPLPLALQRLGKEEGYRVLMQDFSHQGRTLDDQGYELLMEVTQRRSDLPPPPGEQTNTWRGQPVETANRWMGGVR